MTKHLIYLDMIEHLSILSQTDPKYFNKIGDMSYYNKYMLEIWVIVTSINVGNLPMAQNILSRQDGPKPMKTGGKKHSNEPK